MLLPETAALAASMLEDGLKKSGRVGYTETRTLTFDGDATGKDVVPGDIAVLSYVHISNEAIDANTITKIELKAGTSTLVTEIDEIAVIDEITTKVWVKIYTSGIVAVMINKEDTANYGKKGVYVSADLEGFFEGVPAWFSRVELAETIHTIDPKYLPQGGVGYTETRTMTFNGDVTGKHVADFGSGINYVHISDMVVDANKIVKMVAVIDGVAVDGSVIQIDNPEAGISIVTGKFGDTQLSTVLICEQDAPSYNAKKGVSVLFDPNGVLHGYSIVVSLIETEVIHTINPKYLPIYNGEVE